VIGALQKIGAALLTPVAVLPAAALLLRLGAPDIVDLLGFNSLADGSGKEALLAFFAVMHQAGSVVFENLPLLFAVGVGIGLANGAGVAGLAALIGYLVLLAALDGMTPLVVELGLLEEATAIDMGVFGGILAGATAAWAYRNYGEIQLPEYLQFFGGRRFIPIATAFAALLMGIVLGFVWPVIQTAIAAGGQWIIQNDTLGVFIYGTLNRLLLPFGLHHILNSLVWFVVGDFTGPAGTVVHGDLNRFFAGDASAGIFMAGFYPVMMFGLPAAGLAMIRAVAPERRKAISGVLLGAALASFLTGITEPIEFAFMFLAPLLYLAHALLTGVSLVLVSAMGVKHGFGFSAGFIDYLLSFGIATEPLLILVVGLLYGGVYYSLFSYAIRRFNLPTPGREPDGRPAVGSAATGVVQDPAQIAAALCEALGGRSNLVAIDTCITRLRLKTRDDRAVDDAALRAAGAHGVVRLGGGSVQVVMGTRAELIGEKMKEIKPFLRVLSPLTGRTVAIESVPDETFSRKMLGDGLAVEPTEGIAVAPVNGELVTLFPGGHAYGIRTPEGVEVLVHIGIDTVALEGEGFSPCRKQGDYVRAGETIVKFDLERVRSLAPSLITPVVVTNMEKVAAICYGESATVEAGRDQLYRVDTGAQGGEKEAL